MRRRFDSVLLGLVAAAVLASALPASAQDTRRYAPRPHARGQSVSPAYEGWYPNADGSISMVFGYFNRNFEERLDIPIGPDNRIEPGPADRGQPTHFLPRRQTGVFAVQVPADFGEQELTWSLTAYGETIAIPGHLRPEWRIDALENATSGNRPPELRFAAQGDRGMGPAGVATRMQAAPGEPLTLRVWTADDEVGEADSIRQVQGRPRVGVALAWSKYRGPGPVAFSDPRPPLDEAGSGTTTATFDVPGEYTLRVLVSDESGGQQAVMAGGFFCCWTNGFVTVDVR